MNRIRLNVSIFVFCFLTASLPLRAAEATSPADLLPTWTLGYVEIREPAKLVDLLADHPLRQKLEQSPQAKQAMQSAQFRQFQALVTMFEAKLGMDWRTTVKAVAGKSAALGFDPLAQAVVVLAEPSDVRAADHLLSTLSDLARADAKEKNQPDPIATRQYQGATVRTMGEANVARGGRWVVFSNKPAAVNTVLDRIAAGGNALSEDPQFKEARALSAEGECSAWAFVRLAPLRLFGLGGPILNDTQKSDDFGQELILGGLRSALGKTPFLTAALTLHVDKAKLSISSPFDPAWIPAERKFYFGADLDGAERPFEPKGTMVSVTTFRDIPAMWQAGPELFGEGIAAKMAQTDSGLSVFFGGKRFSTDVLTALGPRMQFVAAEQNFQAAGVPEPTIKLPAGAAIFSLTNRAGELEKYFRVGFQSIVALANLDGASKGRPLLEARQERVGDAMVMSATYDPADVKPAPADAAGVRQDIYLNFSPSLVFSPRHLMICSTKQIAHELAELDAKADSAPPRDSALTDNTRLSIDAAKVAAALRSNMEQLIAQNMLEKGHERAAAESEIGLLIDLASAFDRVQLRLTPTDKSVTLELDARLAVQP